MDSLCVSDSPNSLQWNTHLKLRSSFTNSYKAGWLHLSSIKQVLKALLRVLPPLNDFFFPICEYRWVIIPISVWIAQQHINTSLTVNIKATITLTVLSYCVSVQRETSQECKFSKINVSKTQRGELTCACGFHHWWERGFPWSARPKCLVLRMAEVM